MFISYSLLSHTVKDTHTHTRTHAHTHTLTHVHTISFPYTLYTPLSNTCNSVLSTSTHFSYLRAEQRTKHVEMVEIQSSPKHQHIYRSMSEFAQP